MPIRMPEEAMEMLTRNVRGTWTRSSWGIVTGNGTLCTDNQMLPGRYLVIESPNEVVVLTMNDNNELVRVEGE